MVTGPQFAYSDTWQLVINTETTIVTFLMVFLIQHTQNRDTQTVHLMLDELICGAQGARNSLIELESYLTRNRKSCSSSLNVCAKVVIRSPRHDELRRKMADVRVFRRKILGDTGLNLVSRGVTNGRRLSWKS